MTQQPRSNDEAFDAIVAPLAAERASQPTPGEWSLNGFADLYVSERDRLIEVATRYTKDRAESEDIVQEAFLKVALAAPELRDRDHAIAYLTRTVINTALNVVRSTSRRATSVDDLTAAPLDSREIDAFNPAADEAVMRAADTALVTEALSRLTDNQRMALLLTASGDYTTAEVAAQLNISEAQVYTHVSRARAALRRALESIVVDAETGMTAADQLSTVVKKAKANAKTIGQGVAALFLVMAVGLGFWNANTAPTFQQITGSIDAPAAPQVEAPKAPTAVDAPAANQGETGQTAAKPAASAAAKAPTAASQPAASDLTRTNTSDKLGYDFPGVDANGIPTGIFFADTQGNLIAAKVVEEASEIKANGNIVTTSDVTAVTNGYHIALRQTVTWNEGLTHTVQPFIFVNGAWRDLPIKAIASERTTLANSDVLIDTHMLVDASAASALLAGQGGTAVQNVPTVLAIRIHTSQSGSPIYGEVIQVIEPLRAPSQ